MQQKAFSLEACIFHFPVCLSSLLSTETKKKEFLSSSLLKCGFVQDGRDTFLTGYIHKLYLHAYSQIVPTCLSDPYSLVMH
jgi:hypothetical protein